MSGANALLGQLYEAWRTAQPIEPLPPEALDRLEGYGLLLQGLARRQAS
jgi:2-keto-4-pentenoate hydratase